MVLLPDGLMKKGAQSFAETRPRQCMHVAFVYAGAFGCAEIQACSRQKNRRHFQQHPSEVLAQSGAWQVNTSAREGAQMGELGGTRNRTRDMVLWCFGGQSRFGTERK